MKQEVKQGQTDYSVLILIRDTDGAPKTGLTNASAGIDVCYTRVETDNDVALTAGAPVALATPALTDPHLDWGFLQVDATNAPGVYRLDIPDAVFASGAWSAIVSLIATGIDPTHIEFVLVPESPYSGVDVYSVGGTAQTANDNGADINTLITVLGALNDVAAAGDPTDADTLMQYIKQLINVLIGTAGIGTFPAEAAPANAVSIAEVLRAIHVDVTGLNGDAMRGTDSANTTVPDAAGTAAALHAITDGYIDTEIGALSTHLLDIKGTGFVKDTDSLPQCLTAAGFSTHDAAAVKTAIEAGGSHIALIKAVTDALTTAAATKLALSAGTIVTGAAAAGTLSTTEMTTDLTEATDDHYNGRIILWTAGVLQNQATDVTDYDGATKKLTFTATTEAPSDGDAFILV